MVVWLRNLFGVEDLRLVYESRCADLRDEIQRLVEENRNLRDTLFHVTRLDSSKLERSPSSDTSRNESTRNWPQLRQELERRHKKVKTPEDEKAEYWAKKIDEVESEMENASKVG